MVLVATDVAARGIDVEGINCVIHYDPPDDAKAYKHRSGRTARAGNSGVVISFVKKNEQRSYNRIQREVGIRKRFTDPRPEELKKNEFTLVPSNEKREGQSNGNKKRSRRGRSRNSNRNNPNKNSDNHRNNNYRGNRKRRQSRGSKKKADARP
jgi:superfamily II DNA/RNA helicase